MDAVRKTSNPASEVFFAGTIRVFCAEMPAFAGAMSGAGLGFNAWRLVWCMKRSFSIVRLERDSRDPEVSEAHEGSLPWV